MSLSLWVAGAREAKFIPGGEGSTQLELRMSHWTQSMDETCGCLPQGRQARSVNGRRLCTERCEVTAGGVLTHSYI